MALLGLLHLTCQAILNAPIDATLTLTANPTFVEANGGVSVVSAFVVESIGTPVADGTVVQFFTTLGRIDEQGKTNDGVARVNFVSDSRSGTATITAFSGSVTSAAGVDIAVGGVRTVRVTVAAEPTRLTNSRTSQITATVFDANGNPVPNIGVIFTVTTGRTADDFMESGGRTIFTDNDGRARDVFRTRSSFDSAARQVTITATATSATGPTGTVVVFIN
jgi:adhesin/invasin